MFDNPSSSHNVTAVAAALSSIDSLLINCMETKGSKFIVIIHTFMNLLLLPLYILVLSVGFQQWRRQTTAGHSDMFTYQLAVMEVIGVFGTLIYSVGYCSNNMVILIFGTCVVVMAFNGQTLFHTLTCVDRYLAIVHPITYLYLRETSGVKIRNISICCVWLLCVGLTGVMIHYMPRYPVALILSFTTVCLLVICFCNLSVLCALIRPRPGEVGGGKKQVNQSKQRAFYIILATAEVLLFRFAGILSYFCIYMLVRIDLEDLCILLSVAVTMTLPSSLIVNLLFVRRMGKLACCNHNTS